MAVEFKFPDVGEGIHEGTIVKLLVKVGEKVKADQPLMEMETDKAVVELPSPASGTILSINHKEGEKVNVGEVLVTIGEEGESQAAPVKEEKHPIHKAVEKVVAAVSPKPPSSEPENREPETVHRPLASPATRKLARELGVNLELIQGSGPGGRILSEDVRSKASGKVATREGTHVMVKEEKITITPGTGDKRIPLTGLRKTIADRMSYSKSHIPEAVGMDFANVTRLVAIREREKIKAQKQGVHLTYLPFIISAVVIALKKFPKFNANFDEEKQEIVLKSDYNIALAVDTEDGLMAPVLKNADDKSMLDMAREIEELAQKARTRKIQLDELRGGGFTITNVGSAGAMYSVPIINPPQVAIMGVHRIKDMPVVHKGKVVPGKVMGLSLAFDHRVVDGAEATYFMNEIIKHLEDPELLLLDIF